MWLLIRLWCWWCSHAFRWEHHLERPAALVCRRCGHREENGLRWCLETILKE